MPLTKREKGFTHIYATLARLSTQERRRVLVDTVGVYSARQLTQAKYETLMARLEEVLWDRVAAGLAPDPRLCTICRRPLKPVSGGRGACPEGCQVRKVYAWKRTYWRDKLPDAGKANTRELFMLRRVWTLLQDYIPEADRTPRYLAGIIAHTTAGSPPTSAPRRGGRRAVGADPATTTAADYLTPDGQLDWASVPARAATATIEALKDRLNHAL